MTELNAVVKSSLAEILDINQNVEALLEEAKAKRQAAVEPFLAALAESGEVSVIVIRGYTPGFNDGEPCEHSAEFWVNLKDLHEDDKLESDHYGLDLDSEVVEGFQADYEWTPDYKKRLPVPGALEHNRKLAASIGHIWDKPSAEIMSAIGTLLFDTVEEEEDTNYYRTYVLKNGKFEVKSGDYDCGY